jgi:hypothetical protein
MKKIVFAAFLSTLTIFVFAQNTMVTAMEKRAKEMHRVITVNDPNQWKTFIRENYTQALIDKPMRAQIETKENDATVSSSETKIVDNIEAKAGMFRQLHNDFGNSKIISLMPAGEKLEMIVQNAGGLNAAFILRFNKENPYLIDGLGIEVKNEK